MLTYTKNFICLALVLKKFEFWTTLAYRRIENFDLTAAPSEDFGNTEQSPLLKNFANFLKQSNINCNIPVSMYFCGQLFLKRRFHEDLKVYLFTDLYNEFRGFI